MTPCRSADASTIFKSALECGSIVASASSFVCAFESVDAIGVAQLRIQTIRQHNDRFARRLPSFSNSLSAYLSA